MAIDPEVIPPSRDSGNHAVTYVPQWLVYTAIALGVLLTASILKMIFPLLLMGLVVGFIYKQASNI